MNLSETYIRQVVRKVLNEETSSSTMATIFSNHPGNIAATNFYPLIIPNQYKAKYTPGGTWWQNSCAAKMSHAMNKAGFSTGGQYKTEKEYNGVPKGTKFNPSSQAFKTIFRKHFGEPTVTFTTNGSDETIPKEMKGLQGVYVLTTGQWGNAQGHVDAWNGQQSAGGHEYFDVPGTWEFWTQKKINTKNCGWGNDTELYKKSNWKCYSAPEVSDALKNARKCGWGEDLKGYRLSGWKCKK